MFGNFSSTVNRKLFGLPEFEVKLAQNSLVAVDRGLSYAVEVRL
jgi:hypothetical protein